MKALALLGAMFAFPMLVACASTQPPPPYVEPLPPGAIIVSEAELKDRENRAYTKGVNDGSGGRPGSSVRAPMSAPAPGFGPAGYPMTPNVGQAIGSPRPPAQEVRVHCPQISIVFDPWSNGSRVLADAIRDQIYCKSDVAMSGTVTGVNGQPTKWIAIEGK